MGSTQLQSFLLIAETPVLSRVSMLTSVMPKHFVLTPLVPKPVTPVPATVLLVIPNALIVLPVSPKPATVLLLIASRLPPIAKLLPILSPVIPTPTALGEMPTELTILPPLISNLTLLVARATESLVAESSVLSLLTLALQADRLIPSRTRAVRRATASLVALIWFVKEPKADRLIPSETRAVRRTNASLPALISFARLLMVVVSVPETKVVLTLETLLPQAPLLIVFTLSGLAVSSPPYARALVLYSR